MDSMAVSEMIARKFHSNFSQPALLSFDVDDVEDGLSIQRRLDEILEKLMEKHGDIASFDSISYLMSPASVSRANIKTLEEISRSWPELTATVNRTLDGSVLSRQAAETMKQSVISTGEILRSVSEYSFNQDERDLTEVERSWYMTKIKGNYRFLTLIRYSSRVTDTAELKATDARIMRAVQNLPVKVSISGPRQVMEEILSSLVSELVRLGLYVLIATVIFFFALFGHPLGVALSLIPMTGAFALTLGVIGALGMGLPFSIVGVAPLIFGLGMDNGVHVVMGALHDEGSSITDTMAHVTRPIIFTSSTNVLGFVAMLTSQLYSMEFLGWTVVIGMTSAVALTLTTLPAVLLLLERRRARASLSQEAAGTPCSR
jgi:predicted RND superfamily exporter protein